MKNEKLIIGTLVASLSYACVAAFPGLIMRDGRADALYKVGEEATFTLTATSKVAQAEIATNGDFYATHPLDVCMDAFGGDAIQKRTWNPAQEPIITLRGKLNKPGFLRVQLKDNKNDIWAQGKNKGYCWAVGYEPEKICGSTPRPADFEDYWRGEVARLKREVPFDYKKVFLPERSKGKVDTWKVSVATFNGRRTWGFLCVPKAVKGNVPLAVTIKGAGPAFSADMTNGRGDEITLHLNVHYYEPCLTSKEQNALYAQLNRECRKQYGGAINYSTAGAGTSREAYYFHDAIVGLDRIVSYVVENEKNIDSKRVWYYASSQGAGIGMAVTALNSHITRAYYLVPALSDLCGFRKGRQSGWPLLIERQPTAEAKAIAEKTAGYYDAVNFAPMVSIPVRVTVGFADTCCPPYGGWAIYNALKSRDKEMRNGLGMWHSTYPEIQNAFNKWLRSEK